MPNVHDLRKFFDKKSSSIRNSIFFFGTSTKYYGIFLVPLLIDKLTASFQLFVAQKLTSNI